MTTSASAAAAAAAAGNDESTVNSGGIPIPSKKKEKGRAYSGSSSSGDYGTSPFAPRRASLMGRELERVEHIVVEVGSPESPRLVCFFPSYSFLSLFLFFPFPFLGHVARVSSFIFGGKISLPESLVDYLVTGNWSLWL
jgi:hypothetical protein